MIAGEDSFQKNSAKTLICVLRASKGLWDALKELEQESGGQVIVWQGQAKTYKNGGVNAKLFTDQDWDDHPGPVLSDEEKAEIKKELENPAHNRIVVNSFVGENASDRYAAGEYLLAHLNKAYPTSGTTEYLLSYDGNARNDKVHNVDSVDGQGNTIKISEDNAPGGVYAPVIYKAIGVTDITLLDPHSYYQVNNYKDVFGEDHVNVLSSLELIADNIMEIHKDAILDGRFRIGAPDGWDKRDAPDGNAALDRINEIIKLIWKNMPELQHIYESRSLFRETIQFGIIKTRKAAYAGQPAQPETLGMEGNVTGCICVLLDDEVESGGSMTGAADLLIENGAALIESCICHGPTYEESLHKILDHSYEDAEGIEHFAINRLTMTNTMARTQGAIEDEGFYNSLPDRKKKRTTLINCGEVYTAYLREKLGINGPSVQNDIRQEWQLRFAP